MKILHISTSDTGGAGIAAIRLHLSLLECGYNSRFLCLNKTSGFPEVYQYPPQRIKFIYRLLNKFGIPLTNEFRNLRKKARINSLHNSEIYSLPRTDFAVESHELTKECDIIILHWINGFVDITTFLRQITSPQKIFLYVHDFNIIQGGFHTIFDASNNLNPAVQKLEQELKQIKSKAIQDSQNLVLIANSQFTYDKLIKSKLQDKSKIETVPLGIPINEFNALDKKLTKQVLGIFQNSFVILISAVDLNTKHKGIDRFFSVINYLAELNPSKDITIISIGKNFLENEIPKNFKYLNMGVVWNPILKSIIYSAADVVTSTSYEETFGQTIIEGYACGTPALAFRNGALVEIIEEGKTGFLFNQPIDFALKLIELSVNEFLLKQLGENSYQLYNSKYTSKIQANKLIEIINKAYA